ncbi:MAG: tetratricopeptide repeat protein [Acidobacteria bacterium]|nr:MAG: tetratricopeptide repeat protein [Acidobacteriota bacterium]
MAFRREAVIRAAEKYVARGKLEAAIREYRKVLNENPNDASTLNRVGDLYARIGQFDEAVKLFTQIAEQYTEDGFFVKAIAIYKKIIKLDPTSLQVYEKLAELYAKQGLLTEARTQYQVLADYYQKHDNAASAITIYQRMTELEPENPSFHLKLAELYASRSLIDKALQEYRRLADVFMVGGSLDEAAQVYVKALELSADDLEMIEQGVRSLYEGGNVAAAARVLSRAVELNPEAEAIARRIGLAEPEPAGDGEAAVAEEEAPAAGLETPVEDAAAATAETPADDEPPAEDEPPAAAPPEVERIAFTLDLDDELEDDAQPSTLVEPPADLRSDVNAVFEEAMASVTDGEEADEGQAVFTLDLDDDEIPDSLVMPPDDLAETAAGADELDDGAFELVLEEPEGEPAAASAAGETAADEIEVNWSEEMVELDLGELDETFAVSAEEVEPEEQTAPPAAAAAPAAVATPTAVRREEDLLAEAQVFAKYGLREKAEDRLHELLALHPEHRDGLLLLTRIHLQAGEHAQVVEHANTVARLARAAGDLEPWQLLRDELIAAGFTLDDERVIGEPGAELPAADRIAQLLDELDDSAMHSAAGEPLAAAPAPSRLELDLDAGLDGAGAPAAATDAAEEKPADEKPAAEPEPLISLADELDLEELDAELASSAPVPQAAEPAVGTAAGDDEESMGWLDEVTAKANAAPAAEEAIFDEEDDFFDLGAELERELIEDEEDAGGELVSQPQEQSLEDIVEGFKRGVAEHLSPEDYDTHFNLGIAYREMGLIDEAIGEFQLASKDPRHLVDASSMLGMCFVEKGLPELAVRWYRKGLTAPEIREEQTLGLLYDMGLAYRQLGDREAARKTFVEIFGINSNYRDVAGRLEELSETTESPS